MRARMRLRPGFDLSALDLRFAALPSRALRRCALCRLRAQLLVERAAQGRFHVQYLTHVVDMNETADKTYIGRTAQ